MSTLKIIFLKCLESLAKLIKNHVFKIPDDNITESMKAVIELILSEASSV